MATAQTATAFPEGSALASAAAMTAAAVTAPPPSSAAAFAGEQGQGADSDMATDMGPSAVAWGTVTGGAAESSSAEYDATAAWASEVASQEASTPGGYSQRSHRGAAGGGRAGCPAAAGAISTSGGSSLGTVQEAREPSEETLKC